ncbi:tyrosine-protein kinase SRK3-like [Acropora palmata]|uniref:tyrosine-protein kinase SRK3-like n=1 Tax=Acropora palmata TaxID=6131 RepID=UPI003DA04193
MPKPNHVAEALYQIMRNCWQEEPDDRPSFEQLRHELKLMANQHKSVTQNSHQGQIMGLFRMF